MAAGYSRGRRTDLWWLVVAIVVSGGTFWYSMGSGTATTWLSALDVTAGVATAILACFLWFAAMQRRHIDSLPNRLTVHFVTATELPDGNESFEFVITVWNLPLDSPSSIRELAQSAGQLAYGGKRLPLSPYRVSLDRQTSAGYNNYVVCYVLTAPVHDPVPPSAAADRDLDGRTPRPVASVYRVLFPEQSISAIRLRPAGLPTSGIDKASQGHRRASTADLVRPCGTCVMIAKERPHEPIASPTDSRLMSLDSWMEGAVQ